jgi:hypothetical protein
MALSIGPAAPAAAASDRAGQAKLDELLLLQQSAAITECELAENFLELVVVP